MSTTAVSSSSIYQELQAYSQQRRTDVQQLGQDLTSGNLANAQQDFNALQTLGQSGPSANGDVFQSSQRQQDLTAVGQALQSGDLAGAQQAFAELQSTFHQNHYPLPPSPAPLSANPTSNSTSASNSPSTSASGSSIYQQVQAYFQQRSADVQQLGQDLTSGNLTNAQQDYNALQALGQSGPFKSGDAFSNSQREQDLNAIGQALQSGDLAGAQQAYAQLQATFHHHQHHTPPPITAPPIIIISVGDAGSGHQTSPPVTAPPSSTGVGATASSGTEIILNLANAPAGEQITIGLANQGNGTEQVTISANNPQNQTPEQVTLNLNLNTNQQIVLNLFGSCTSSPTQGSSFNTTA